MKKGLGMKAKIAIAVVAGLLVGGAAVYAVDSVSDLPSKQAEQVVLENVEESTASEEQKAPEATEAANISLEKAKEIALAEVPGAGEGDIVKAYEDKDDGRVEFDVEIHYDGYEYEFEIDEESGKIFDKDVDKLGYDD